MNYQKLLQQMVGVTLVMLLLVGCNVPAATRGFEAPAATSAPEQAATPTPEPPTATLTSTPVATSTDTPEPPTTTPAPAPPTAGGWTASAEFGGFRFTVNPDLTGISEITYGSFNLECGSVEVSCGSVEVSWGKSQVTPAEPWPITAGQFTIEGNIVDSPVAIPLIIRGEFDETGTLASGTWEVDAAGTVCSGAWESHLGSDTPATAPTPELSATEVEEPTAAVVPESATAKVRGKLIGAESQEPLAAYVKLCLVIDEEHCILLVAFSSVSIEDGDGFEFTEVPPDSYWVAWGKIDLDNLELPTEMAFLEDSEGNNIQVEVVAGQTVDLGEVLVTVE